MSETKKKCKHELSGDFVTIPVELEGDNYQYISKLSEACGYSMEVVIGVLVAYRMEQIARLGEELMKTSQAASRKKSNRRQPKLSKKPIVPKAKSARPRKSK